MPRSLSFTTQGPLLQKVSYFLGSHAVFQGEGPDLQKGFLTSTFSFFKVILALGEKTQPVVAGV